MVGPALQGGVAGAVGRVGDADTDTVNVRILCDPIMKC